MIRTILWTTIWMITLGALTINVKYADGLEIELHGWVEHLKRMKRP